jgi:8-oxo-dGTP pyrophosphatase MutT (NUDIX family)
VVLLRDGAEGLEVLLVERNPDARFMGGAWVFPGGAVGDEDSGPEACALRELDEEAGIRLSGPEALVPFSHWITPSEVTIRFDTRFFAAAAPEGAEPRPDGEECVDARWLRPGDALEAGGRGELSLVFPTIKQLERLVEPSSVEEALEVARATEVVAIQPRVVGTRVVLPGEPGYD